MLELQPWLFVTSKHVIFLTIVTWLIYNAKQNICTEVKKSREIWQDQKTLISFFTKSLRNMFIVSFQEGRCPHTILWFFKYFLIGLPAVFDDFKNQRKRVWSNVFRYVKVYIFWKFIQSNIHWDKKKMLKNISRSK